MTIEVEVKHASTFPGLSRNLLNPYLEAWYNAKNPTWEASPIYVPYHATFGPRTYHFPPPEKTTVIIEQEIDPEIQTAVNRIIEKHIHRPLSDSENTPNCLLESLGMDSLDRMEITILVELKFPTATELELVPTRIGELWALAQGAKVSVLEGSGLVATPSEAEGRC